MPAHVLTVKSVENVPDEGHDVIVDVGYDIDIECPGVTDACAEWEECGTPGCAAPTGYVDGLRDVLDHGVEHRWFREPAIWGVRSGICFAVNHGHGVAGELAERLKLDVGRYEVEPVFEDGSLQGFDLIGAGEASLVQDTTNN